MTSRKYRSWPCPRTQGWAPHVQVESLQGSLCGRERGGLRSGALPPLDTGRQGWSRRGWQGRENRGKTRDKDTAVHAAKALHRGVTKAVVPKEGPGATRRDTSRVATTDLTQTQTQLPEGT
ncbi:unnamed protein product [Closterium sp. NIES-64]|nr:unnamed protein product [Closterium sp. NIES-64]